MSRSAKRVKLSEPLVPNNNLILSQIDNLSLSYLKDNNLDLYYFVDCIISELKKIKLFADVANLKSFFEILENFKLPQEDRKDFFLTICKDTKTLVTNISTPGFNKSFLTVYNKILNMYKHLKDKDLRNSIISLTYRFASIMEELSFYIGDIDLRNFSRLRSELFKLGLGNGSLIYIDTVVISDLTYILNAEYYVETSIRRYNDLKQFNKIIKAIESVKNLIKEKFSDYKTFLYIVAVAYKKTFNYKFAIDYFTNIIAELDVNNNVMYSSIIYNELARCYIELRDYLKVIHFLNLIPNKTCHNYADIGSSYYKLKKFPKAIEYLRKSIEVDVSMQLKKSLVYQLLAKCYLNSKKYDEAVINAHISLNLDKGKDNSVMVLREILAKGYLETKDFKNSYIHYNFLYENFYNRTNIMADMSESHRQYARFLFKMGEYENAKCEFEKIINRYNEIHLDHDSVLSNYCHLILCYIHLIEYQLSHITCLEMDRYIDRQLEKYPELSERKTNLRKVMSFLENELCPDTISTILLSMVIKEENIPNEIQV